MVGLAVKAADPVVEANLIGIKNEVRVLRAGASTWDTPNLSGGTNVVALYAGDQVRTGGRSRAKLRLRDGSITELDEFTVTRLGQRPDRGVIEILRGVMSLFHRDEPGRIEVYGNGVSALVRGTEFTFAARPDGSVELALLDGEVGITNQVGGLTLNGGELATVRPGEAPRRTALLTAGGDGVVQWLLYYPAVLALPDLDIPAVVRTELSETLRHFEAGDLLAAVASYPKGRRAQGREEQVLLAALALGVGNVVEAEGGLAGVVGDDAAARLAGALRHIIAATLRRPDPGVAVRPALASEWLALSYVRQSIGDIPGALMAARSAVQASPGVGLAWARVAELEFSSGRTAEAWSAVDRALVLSPRHPQALALKGFLHAAQLRNREAEALFDRAIALDPGLGNAWLGRGLARIRLGRWAEGQQDLTVAAATEPNRALLRSYLGKAFAAAGDRGRAAHELFLARRLDPLDPTAWLYSALLLQQENRVNAAVADLERSTELNDERRLYRSRFLLDQDRAVRAANLARVYADAGFTEVAEREATRAVDADYANAAAHLFLADSYDAVRDPRQVNLRHETPWFSEFLVGNLLAPVGASSLSQTVSQNEYASLFEHDRLGVVSDTLWTGNGDWRESGAQFGRVGGFAYAVDALYRNEVGQRPNEDLDQLTIGGQFKWQLGPSDGLLLQVVRYEAEGGDLAQRRDPAEADPALRIQERQDPLVLAGWHHEWRPGVHTLMLVGGFRDWVQETDPDRMLLQYYRYPDGAISPPTGLPSALDYQSRFSGWTTELQQIWQADVHTIVVGARLQEATFDTSATLESPLLAFLEGGSDTRRVLAASPGLERVSLYGYDHWRPISWMQLTAGVSHDRLTQPENFRTAPVSDSEQHPSRTSPKLGLTLTPWQGGVVRGAYTRSLGGVSFDQSFRLEPSQVAGFTQSYRGLIPEALQGSVGGQDLTTWGVAWDQTFPSRTYVTVSGERLSSTAVRGVGAFELQDDFLTYAVGGTRQALDFVERNLVASASQLVGEHLAFTTRYRVSEATLESSFPEATAPDLASRERSVLHQLQLEGRFNHASGAFATVTATWNRQSAPGPGMSGDDFWQQDLWVGWRLFQRRAELSVGVINLTGQDYRLSPLNLYSETYRDRTFALRARVAF